MAQKRIQSETYLRRCISQSWLVSINQHQGDQNVLIMLKSSRHVNCILRVWHMNTFPKNQHPEKCITTSVHLGSCRMIAGTAWLFERHVQTLNANVPIEIEKETLQYLSTERRYVAGLLAWCNKTLPLWRSMHVLPMSGYLRAVTAVLTNEH